MRSHPKALFAVMALLAFLLVPTNALAGKKTEFLVPTGGPGGGVAVGPTGDVYVQIPGGDRIERYDAGGNLLGQFGETGAGDGQFSFGSTSVQLAIDQADGSIYVPDPGNFRVQKFAADGTYITQFGSEGTGDGQFTTPLGIVVDPSTQDVLVADMYFADPSVQRFSSTGSFEGDAIDASGRRPMQLTLDSNARLYVLDESRFITRFASNGAVDSAFSMASFIPEGISIDPASDHVLASGFPSDFSKRQIVEFDESGAIVDGHAEGADVEPGGLAASPDSSRYYMTDRFNARFFALTDAGAPPPTVSIEPVVLNGFEATFTGTVNPNGGFETSWRFEYSGDGGATWRSTAGGNAGDGTSVVSVTDTVTDLEPNLNYRVRLVATKAFGAGSAISNEELFVTEPVPPVVQALDPGPVTATSAWLGAKVDPENASTTYYVEYSTDPSFTSSVVIPSGQDASAGSGGSPVLANALVKGLQPNIDYHYRVVASNVAGTVTGESRTFSTLSPVNERGLPNGRVWEKVSPSAKGGANIYPGPRSGESAPLSNWAQAAVGGDAVTFASAGKWDGAGGPPYSQYLARRGPNGWTTEGISPKVDPKPGIIFNNSKYVWFSDDLSMGLVESNAAINPGDPDFVINNLYLRENGSGAYRLISNADESTPRNEGVRHYFQVASASAERVVFLSEQPTGTTAVFARSGDGSVLKLPGNAGASRSLPDTWDTRANAVSDDGSRIYVNDTPGTPQGVQYLIEGNQSPVLISRSEKSGDDPAIGYGGEFMGASADGSIAYFLSSAALTEDSAPGGTKLYRYEADASAGQRLTDITALGTESANALGVTALSEDGDSVYFVADGDFAGQGKSVLGLYLWRDEGVRLVAADLGERHLWEGNLTVTESIRQARVTSDGRYLAFATPKSLTAYDTNGINQLYLFDSENDRITCISCGTVESKSKQGSWFLSCATETSGFGNPCLGTRYLTHNLSSDGARVVFDSKDALVPEDSNGLTDVYQWEKGELDLLSTGTSGTPSRLLDASEDGDDVFFTTSQQLVRSDADNLVDLYDARVGGAEEPSVMPPCVGDECQGTPSPPPSFSTLGSRSFTGTGNVKPSSSRCGKAKVRRKGRCIKKPRKAPGAARSRGRGKANSNRRAKR